MMSPSCLTLAKSIMASNATSSCQPRRLQVSGRCRALLTPVIVVCSLVGLGIIVGIIKWRMRVSNRAHQLKVAQASNKTTP